MEAIIWWYKFELHEEKNTRVGWDYPTDLRLGTTALDIKIIIIASVADISGTLHEAILSRRTYSGFMIKKKKIFLLSETENQLYRLYPEEAILSR